MGMPETEIYLKEDGWYYRGDDLVEWGPFESYDEAESMSTTPETHFDSLGRSAEGMTETL